MAVDETQMALQVGQQALDSLAGMVWGGLAVIIGVVVVIFLVYLFSYRHTVLVKVLGSRGVKYPYRDKAKVYMVDGVMMWRLQKRKDIISPPPKNCLVPNGKDITGKPKFYAECYYSDELGYVWAEDTVGDQDFIGRVEKDANGVEVVRGVYQPVTTQERSLIVSNVIKAQARKKKSLFEQITAFAIPIALIMLFVMVLVFWEDIAKPVKEMSQIQASIATENAKISEQNARMLSVLAGKLEAGDIVIDQRVPPDGGAS